jgi:hypothetical protein
VERDVITDAELIAGGECVWCHLKCQTRHVDPYAAEIGGIERWVWLHDGECYQELVWEI